MLHVPFKRYAILNFLGGFIWTALLVAVGFFFGNVYDALRGPAKIIFVVAAIALVVWGLWAINRYLVKKEI
jgi:membrane protein DedA with SNARE-associated domain